MAITINDWVAKQLTPLLKSDFYGKMSVEIQGGAVVLVRIERTVMPPRGLPAVEEKPFPPPDKDNIKGGDPAFWAKR